jgi:hypothetical protein
VDVGLIQVDQPVPVAARTGEHVLELLDERLPPHRVGPAEQLLGLLPAQVETVESRPDRLAAAGRAELFAHPAGQALEGPAVRRVGAGYGRGDGGALGGADGFAKASPDAGTKIPWGRRVCGPGRVRVPALTPPEAVAWRSRPRPQHLPTT